MIVDEVRHPLAGSVREQRQPFNKLNVLSNGWRLLMIVLAIREALYATQADP